MQINKSFWKKTLYWLALGFLLAVSVLLLFDNLGLADVQWADESRHGVNAYEMMQNNEYLVNLYRGETDYWNLKPPLSFYGVMLGYRLFGFTTFGMRFYSAASMFGTMVIMALWMKKRYGSIASLGCQLFLMACSIVYAPHYARYGDADSLMLLFYVIGMICMLESQRDLRWLYGSALSFGFAFMAKSWHAALIPVTCFVFVCVTAQLKKLKLKNYLLLLFFGLLPVAPWLIARMRFDGLTFFKSMITTDVVARATTVHEMHSGDWLYYIQFLLREPTVAFTLVILTGVLIWQWKTRRRLSGDAYALGLWFWMPILLYSLCVSKLEWYVFVSVPALAVSLGIVLQKLCTSLSPHSKSYVPRILCLLLCTVFLAECTLDNLRYVNHLVTTDPYDKLIPSAFNRERDSGKHIYIQYESENSYAEYDYRKWMQGEVLMCQLYGDLICLDGGTKAFVEDSHPSYLIAHEVGLETELLQDAEQVFAWGPLRIFTNHS